MRNIEWFPGHMAAAARQLRSFFEQAELILHTVDARAPSSTLATQFLPRGKQIVVFFTMRDLADPKITALWERSFKESGLPVFDSTQGSLERFKSAYVRQGSRTPLHAVVVGFPNVGKSTLINRLLGKHKTATGAKPGITRGPQWVRLMERFYLLDMPGVFFPKKVSPENAWRLAAIGTLPEKTILPQIVDLCRQLVTYANLRHGVFTDEMRQPFFDFLEAFGRRQGFLLKAGKVDPEAAARRLISDFQKGKWGRISLETP